MAQQVNSPDRIDHSRNESSAADRRQKASASDKRGSSRLQQKIKDLKPRLRHAEGPLKNYAQAAIDRASGKKVSASFAELDATHLPKMVEVENQRNPGLNLRYFNNHMEFIEAIKDESQSSFRAIFPQTRPETGRPVQHHVMADVRQ